MRWNRITTVTAVSAAVAAQPGTCGRTRKATPGGGVQRCGVPKAEFNAAVGKVFNPSDKKGGTLRMAISRGLGLR